MGKLLIFQQHIFLTNKIKKFIPKSPTALAEECLDQFHDNIEYISFSTVEDGCSKKITIGEQKISGQHIHSMIDKYLNTNISIHTNEYVVFHNKTDMPKLEESDKKAFNKYIVKYHLTKVNQAWCIEKLIEWLVATLLLILIIGIAFKLSVNTASDYKLYLFFVVSFFSLWVNYAIVMKFYSLLKQDAETGVNLFLFKRLTDGKYKYVLYNNEEFGLDKSYSIFITGYFLIIITFSFYVSSLL